MLEPNKMPIARNRFEELGVRLVVNETSFGAMRSAYDVCCIRCALHGRYAGCDSCPIRESFLVAAELVELTEEDRNYLELERAASV